jgi:hypothetical protein
MGPIQIKHPTLDDGRIVEVSEESWPHHAKAGWVRADQPEPVPEPPAEADVPDPKPRRSRITKED